MIPILATDSPDDRVAKAADVVPTPQQLAWQRNELSGFIHFGPNTFTGVEWGGGDEAAEVFAPTDVDTAQWARACNEAGFGKVIMVAKHHEGFALYPTRYSDFSVASSGWRGGAGDLVREFVDAMRAQGLRVGFYLSPADLHESRGRSYANGSVPRPVVIPTLVAGDDRAAALARGDLPTFQLALDDYNAFYLNQLYELLTQYGEVDEIWLDGANPTGRPQPYDWRAWFDVIEALQPGAVVFNGQGVRWVGNEAGQARETEWSVLPFTGDPATTRYNHEVDVEWAADLGSRDRLLDPRTTYLAWFPAECDVPIDQGWFWNAENEPKSLARLQEIYHASVGRNSQLLLSLPPDRTGRLTGADVARLLEFGAWVRAAYGEDPARGAVVSASSGADSAMNVVDADPDTYWRPGELTGSVTLSFGAALPVASVILQEAIAHGQRIEGVDVEGALGGEWRCLAKASTVGHKRILPLDEPVTIDSLRVTITASRALPALSRVGVSSNLFLDRHEAPAVEPAMAAATRDSIVAARAAAGSA